mmetsp:Transcript_55904/g.130899  ORF Transcript_55904/g.130899 Transcript_55904/m.130899 type:complete len:158 (+) Transcript_55904:60-533(+)
MAPRRNLKGKLAVHQQEKFAAGLEASTLPPTAQEENDLKLALEASNMLARAEELQAEELRRILELSQKEEEERRLHQEEIAETVRLSTQAAEATSVVCAPAATLEVSEAPVVKANKPLGQCSEAVLPADDDKEDEFILEGDFCEDALDEWVVVDSTD